MKRFIARMSMDYSTVISAETEEEAIKIARNLPIDDWGSDGYSDVDVEEYE